MRLRLIAFLTLSLTIISFACDNVVRAAQINFAPLFRYESDEESYDLSIAGPILEFSSGSVAVRPLYYRDDTQTDILYPLGRSTKINSHFVPLFRYSNQNEVKNFDLLLFTYGRDHDQTYGAFFPFYGNLINRFGHDRIRFVLWPLYTRIVDDDQETYSILWPFLKYSSGREFQLFPLYGYEKTINYRHDYVLWPLIHHRRGVENIDAVLPFFYYTRNETYRGISILWPFFTYNRNTSPEHTSITFPWPFVRYASGAYEERQFFPFYWSKIQGNAYRMQTVLWPFYRHVSSFDSGTNTRQDTVSILLLSSKAKTIKKEVVESESLTVWPLWHNHKYPGHSSWYFPWIVPLHDEGFRKNYLPLLTLANGKSTPESSELDILWHTVSLRREDALSRFSLSFLFSYERGPEYKQVGFLSDLLHWRWVSSGKEHEHAFGEEK